jgi:hypothetical protein
LQSTELLEPQCHKALFRLINQYQRRSVRDPSPKIIQKYEKSKTTNNYEFSLSVDPGFFPRGLGGVHFSQKEFPPEQAKKKISSSLHRILFIP